MVMNTLFGGGKIKNMTDTVISQEKINKIKKSLSCLKEDFEMLKNGSWKPDNSSCNDSIEMIERIANNLKITI